MEVQTSSMFWNLEFNLMMDNKVDKKNSLPQPSAGIVVTENFMFFPECLWLSNN